MIIAAIKRALDIRKPIENTDFEADDGKPPVREVVLVNVEHSTCEQIELYHVSRFQHGRRVGEFISPWVSVGHALNAETAIKHGTRIDVVQGWIDRTTGTIFLGNRMPPIVPLV